MRANWVEFAAPAEFNSTRCGDHPDGSGQVFGDPCADASGLLLVLWAVAGEDLDGAATETLAGRDIADAVTDAPAPGQVDVEPAGCGAVQRGARLATIASQLGQVGAEVTRRDRGPLGSQLALDLLVLGADLLLIEQATGNS